MSTIVDFSEVHALLDVVKRSPRRGQVLNRDHPRVFAFAVRYKLVVETAVGSGLWRISSFLA